MNRGVTTTNTTTKENTTMELDTTVSPDTTIPEESWDGFTRLRSTAWGSRSPQEAALDFAIGSLPHEAGTTAILTRAQEFAAFLDPDETPALPTMTATDIGKHAADGQAIEVLDGDLWTRLPREEAHRIWQTCGRLSIVARIAG